jgi:hypothetical protein
LFLSDPLIFLEQINPASRAIGGERSAASGEKSGCYAYIPYAFAHHSRAFRAGFRNNPLQKTAFLKRGEGELREWALTIAGNSASAGHLDVVLAQS